MVHLWEIESLVRDAVDCLRRASELALEASGYNPGRQGGWIKEPISCYCGENPDCIACAGEGSFLVDTLVPDEPADEGWKAMVEFSGDLVQLGLQVLTCIPPEIEAAIREEKDIMDQYDEPGSYA